MDDLKLFEALEASSNAICSLYMDGKCDDCPMDLKYFDTCLSVLITNIRISREDNAEKESEAEQ